MKFFIKTFGCQMNVNDSEKIRSILQQKGFQYAKEAEADLIVINSCAVREKAQQKIFSYAGRQSKDTRIIVAGCVSQSEKESILSKNTRIQYVIGTHQYYDIGRIVDEIMERNVRGVCIGFEREWKEFVPDFEARSSPVTAYVSIMEGCDNFCSYCIVPFTRSREKHRPYADILSECEMLAEQGFSEIILLGQNVNSWRDENERIGFPRLLERLGERIPVTWIRFITSYPGYHNREIISVLKEYPRIARHIHFPAQSGSTRILKKMNRSYTRLEYIRIVETFVRQIPGMKFSSDFIVGFPGETENDFKLTLSMIEAVEFESIFSFIYSPRKYSSAFSQKESLEQVEKKDRLHRLQRLQDRIQLKNNRMMINSEVDVLVTGNHPRKKGEVIGRTETYRVVNFPASALPGELTRVRVTAAGPHSLRGEVVAASDY